jgi:predicted amidohydrolase
MERIEKGKLTDVHSSCEAEVEIVHNANGTIEIRLADARGIYVNVGLVCNSLYLWYNTENTIDDEPEVAILVGALPEFMDAISKD